MSFSLLSIALVFSFIASLLGTGWLRSVLVRHHVIDTPNSRSSHTIPTPRGAGLVTVAVLLACFAFFSFMVPGHALAYWPLMAGVLIVTAISWLDDVATIAPRWRLLMQIAAVTLVMAFARPRDLVFHGYIPEWADTLLAGLAWLWFINLYNFMDGLDGITGTQTIFIATGISVLGLMNIGDATDYYYALILIAAMLGFLKHNWHPATIFIGDVGSISLGFVLGWMLLNLAASGNLTAALILPAYYVTDTSITLIRRLIAGKKIWESHAEHFYQKALKIRGLSHTTIVGRICIANTLLLGLAVASAMIPYITIIALSGAALVVAALLYSLSVKKGEQSK